MLHHAKVMKAFIELQNELFCDNSTNLSLVQASWQRICADPLFQIKARSRRAQWPLPSWQGAIDKQFTIAPLQGAADIIAIDGSQIYPDRHQGSSCYLINIGAVYLHYGQSSRIQLESTPYLYLGREANELEDAAVEVVNAKRQELELRTGCEWAKQLFHAPHASLFLFDGSIIFWHLSALSDQMKQHYMSSYLQLMHQCYLNDVLYAGYISLPKSKELVNLIRTEFALHNIEIDVQEVDHIVDTVVASFFLSPGNRTTVFRSNATVCNEYAPPLVPHFFYMHTGDEIARIEIPAWIAQDGTKTDTVATLILDQAIKGRGYPVALAEAHEQAVVKGADRDFFYQMLQKLAVEHKKQHHISQKSAKKRMMNI